MTLAEELQLLEVPRLVSGRARLVRLEEPPLRLPFNGKLSADELRMAEQFTFDGPASWEE